jgi:hypothetical protein
MTRLSSSSGLMADHHVAEVVAVLHCVSARAMWVPRWGPLRAEDSSAITAMRVTLSIDVHGVMPVAEVQWWPCGGRDSDVGAQSGGPQVSGAVFVLGKDYSKWTKQSRKASARPPCGSLNQGTYEDASASSIVNVMALYRL